MSHWGNIAVEEDYEVEHNGAKLIGEFSRHEHVKKIWKGDTADMGKNATPGSLELKCFLGYRYIRLLNSES